MSAGALVPPKSSQSHIGYTEQAGEPVSYRIGRQRRVIEAGWAVGQSENDTQATATGCRDGGTATAGERTSSRYGTRPFRRSPARTWTKIWVGDPKVRQRRVKPKSCRFRYTGNGADCR